MPSNQKQNIKRLVAGMVASINEVIVDSMINVGEQFVIDARSTNTYKDRTSNLRGSIGYTILKDGEELFGSFEGLSSVGNEAGKQLVNTIKSRYSSGYTLICAAGMSYAVYVEAKGFDVITGSAQLAETNFVNELKKIITKISKA